MTPAPGSPGSGLSFRPSVPGASGETATIVPTRQARSLIKPAGRFASVLGRSSQFEALSLHT